MSKTVFEPGKFYVTPQNTKWKMERKTIHITGWGDDYIFVDSTGNSIQCSESWVQDNLKPYEEPMSVNRYHYNPSTIRIGDKFVTDLGVEIEVKSYENGNWTITHETSDSKKYLTRRTVDLGFFNESIPKKLTDTWIKFDPHTIKEGQVFLAEGNRSCLVLRVLKGDRQFYDIMWEDTLRKECSVSHDFFETRVKCIAKTAPEPVLKNSSPREGRDALRKRVLLLLGKSALQYGESLRDEIRGIEPATLDLFIPIHQQGMLRNSDRNRTIDAIRGTLHCFGIKATVAAVSCMGDTVRLEVTDQYGVSIFMNVRVSSALTPEDDHPFDAWDANVNCLFRDRDGVIRAYSKYCLDDVLNDIGTGRFTFGDRDIGLTTDAAYGQDVRRKLQQQVAKLVAIGFMHYKQQRPGEPEKSPGKEEKVSQTSPINPSIWDMLQANAKKAAPLISGEAASKGLRAGILMMLKSKGADSSQLQMVQAALNTEYGRAGLEIALGVALAFTPGIKDHPAAKYLAEGCQVDGMRAGGAKIMDDVSQFIVPALLAVLNGQAVSEEFVMPEIDVPAKTRINVEANSIPDLVKQETLAEQEAMAKSERLAAIPLRA
jgi:hypothetical protein